MSFRLMQQPIGPTYYHYSKTSWNYMREAEYDSPTNENKELSRFYIPELIKEENHLQAYKMPRSHGNINDPPTTINNYYHIFTYLILFGPIPNLKV